MESNSSCDLHIHSSYSDGALPPAAIVRCAADGGLSAVSITDHDTSDGQEEAVEAGRLLGIEVVTGIEFSVNEMDLDIHILGYCFDPVYEGLAAAVVNLEKGRIERAGRIAAKLSDLGIEISLEEIIEDAGDGTIGRPHIARILLRRGVVSRFQEAFDRFLGYRAPCYVPKTVLELEEVISIIEEAGGVAVWAHPGLNMRNRALLKRIIGCGVKGIEAWHPNHDPAITKLIVRETGRLGLVATGGSDYHFSEAEKVAIGEIEVPYDSVIALRRLAGGVST
jgi:predicted metal-dependent phosphoesterase TrpH